MYNKRSSRFNFFKNYNPEERKPKHYIKNTIKVFAVFVLVFSIVVSLVGCFQSFITRGDSGLGSGVEITQKGHLSPKITKFKIQSSDDGIYSIEKDEKYNSYFNPKKEEDKEELEKINKYLEEETAGYGLNFAKWGFNGGIVLEDEKGVLITKDKELSKVSSLEDKTYLVFTYSPTYKKENYKNTLDKQKKLEILIPNQKKSKNKEFVYDKAKFTFDDIGNFHLKKYKINFLNFILSNPKIKDFLEDINSNKEKNLEKKEKIFKAQKELINKVLLYIKADSEYKESEPDKQKTEKYSEISIKIFGENNNEDNKKGFDTLKESDWKIPGVTTNKKGETVYFPIYDFKSAWGLGPFFSLVVYPLARLYSIISNLFGAWSGWDVLIALIITIFICRLVQFLVGFKSKLQQSRIESLNYKKQNIEAKYSKYKDNRQMMFRKQTEIQKLYKKNNINQFLMFAMIFVQMPIFLGLWRVINGTQEIKTALWLSINFSDTSYKMLFSGSLQYLPIIVLAFTIQMISALLPKWLNSKDNKYKNVLKVNPENQNTMAKVQKYLPFIFPVMSLMFSAGLQIYWIIGGVFSIIEALIFYKLNKSQKIKNKTTGYQQYEFIK